MQFPMHIVKAIRKEQHIDHTIMTDAGRGTRLQVSPSSGLETRPYPDGSGSPLPFTRVRRALRAYRRTSIFVNGLCYAFRIESGEWIVANPEDDLAYSGRAIRYIEAIMAALDGNTVNGQLRPIPYIIATAATLPQIEQLPGYAQERHTPLSTPLAG